LPRFLWQVFCFSAYSLHQLGADSGLVLDMAAAIVHIPHTAMGSTAIPIITLPIIPTTRITGTVDMVGITADITRVIIMAAIMVGIMVATDVVTMEVDIIDRSRNHILAFTAGIQVIGVKHIGAATQVTGVVTEVATQVIEVATQVIEVPQFVDAKKISLITMNCERWIFSLILDREIE
jgi:hypothetical protein